jgi:transketolase
MELFTVVRSRYAAQSGQDAASLRALCAFNRINALSCIKSAEHGWLGASFSVAELLTVLYFRLGERNVVLSKGHAAAMQYACLFGLGTLERTRLLAYKDGPAGLGAHTERGTPGILFTTGSLGQALSRTAGLAVTRPQERFCVVHGDGELQEGQCFEAFQTVVHRNLRDVTTVIDVNGFQTELPVTEVKRIADLGALFGGLGFAVRDVDGHDMEALHAALAAPVDRPLLVLSRTRKAGGTDLLPPEDGRQPWHGRIPDDDLYRRLVAEQAERSGVPDLQTEVRDWLAHSSPSVPSAKPAPAVVSTRDGFVRRLEELLDVRPELAVLDADLAHPCGLDRIAARGRQFFEMGIAEQDMISFAGGLALGGRLPVVNTYASFYKRAIEQLQLNLVDGLRVIYAGHYAGLCYYTDGKTHQSLNDLSLMTALPQLWVVEPPDACHAAALLDWAVAEADRSVYFRLRRTPLALELPEVAVRPDRPLVLPGDGRRWLWTIGTVSTRLALDALARPAFRGWGVIVQSVLRGPLDLEHHRTLLAGAERIVTIEEDLAPGALRRFVTGLCGQLGVSPRISGKAIDRAGACFRTLDACRTHFGFRVEELERVAGI